MKFCSIVRLNFVKFFRLLAGNNMAFVCKTIFCKNFPVYCTHILKIVKEENVHYEYEPILLPKVVTKACPPGFMLDNDGRKCICTNYVANRGITCSINSVKLQRNLFAWVGNHSGIIVVHQNCLFDYCKRGFMNVDPFNQQE